MNQFHCRQLLVQMRYMQSSRAACLSDVSMRLVITVHNPCFLYLRHVSQLCVWNVSRLTICLECRVVPGRSFHSTFGFYSFDVWTVKASSQQSIVSKTRLVIVATLTALTFLASAVCDHFRVAAIYA